MSGHHSAPTTPEAAIQQARILWGAHLFACLIFIVISFVVPKSQPNPELDLLLYVFAGLALMELPLIFILRQVLWHKPLQRGDLVGHERLAKYQAISVMTFGLGEAIAIYGLVLHMLHPEAWTPYPFFALGFTVIASFFPSMTQLKP